MMKQGVAALGATREVGHQALGPGLGIGLALVRRLCDLIL